MNEEVAYKEKLRCVKNTYDYRSKYFFFFGARAQIGPRPLCLRFLDHTHTHTHTHRWTLLKELPARRSGHYLHNTQQT